MSIGRCDEEEAADKKKEHYKYTFHLWFFTLKTDLKRM